MDNFDSAIQNYRQSTGTIAQSMLQGTVNQIEGQEEMTESKAQILSAADNSDSQTNVTVNMSDTLDKLGLDFGVKEIGKKVLPWVSKKIAGQVVNMNTARASREASRLGARPQNSRFPDQSNPATGDGNAVNTGKGAGGDAGGSSIPKTPLRSGKAPKSGGDDASAGGDAGAGGSEVNIASKSSVGDTSFGDAFSSLRGGASDIANALRASMSGDVGAAGRIVATTSQQLGRFSKQVSTAADPAAQAARAARAYNPNRPGQLRVPKSQPAQAEPEMSDTAGFRNVNQVPPGQNNPFSGDGPTVSLRTSYTPGQGVNRLPGQTPDVTARPTALTRDPALDAEAAARRAAAAAGDSIESSTGADALAIAGRGIGMLADVLGPAAAIYGIIEAGHGLYEDAKLQSDDAFQQAKGVIAQAQQQQNNLSADISADQFASKVGAARPSFGSLAAPSLDTSQGMMAGGGHF